MSVIKTFLRRLPLAIQLLNKISYIPIFRNMYLLPQMRKLLFLITLLIASGLVYSEAVSAQQAQESDGSLLPDIDPQDIEIRSQYRARFPGLQRQPILGFRPGSRVYQVDPDRSPYLEDLEEIAAQLPVDQLTRPEEPEYRFFPYSDPRTGYGYFGIGNYMSAEAAFHANHEVADNQWLSGSFDYTSGDSHLNQNSSFRHLDIDSNYRGKIGNRTIIGANFGLSSDFNYLPRLNSELFELSYNPGRKDYSDMYAGTRVKWFQNSIEHLDIGANAWYSSITLDEAELGFISDVSDWGVAVDGAYYWAGQRIEEVFAINADLQAGGSERLENQNESWSQLGASGTYRRFFNYNTLVDATIGFYHVTDATENSTFYFAPDIRASHYLTERITLSAKLLGKPEHPGHMDHHRINRFLLPDNQLEHSFNLETAVEIVIEPLPNNQVRLGASYLSGKNYPIYLRPDFELGIAPILETVPGHYAIEYRDVTIQRAYAGIDVDLIRERLWFDVEGYYQNPKISATQKIPFTESYGLKGAVSIRPVDRILLEGWGTFVGSRETMQNDELDSFLNLGTKLELRITEQIGVYGKMVNLLNQEYEIWKGFNERPFQVYAGVTVIF
jgi:hypothetical protein